jgi:hypothetical protein
MNSIMIKHGMGYWGHDKVQHVHVRSYAKPHIP